MPLSDGTRLGSYEILSAIGAGGMGEVYRARDTRLDPDVAIKIVPRAFVADAERVARFQREARVLASLNHRARVHKDRLTVEVVGPGDIPVPGAPEPGVPA